MWRCKNVVLTFFAFRHITSVKFFNFLTHFSRLLSLLLKMITRAGNANKHPGEVQIRSSQCRPKQVIQAERMAKAAEKEKRATEMNAAIQKLAEIEHDTRKKVKNSKPEVIRPMSNMARRVSARPRKAVSVAGGKLTVNIP